MYKFDFSFEAPTMTDIIEVLFGLKGQILKKKNGPGLGTNKRGALCPCTIYFSGMKTLENK